MKFNINNYVKVKLTDWGLEVHKKHYDKFLPTFINYSMPIIDEDGYTKFQLWELCSIFGEYMGNGLPNCFETTIIFADKDLICI